MEPADVFISFNSRDRETARSLLNLLQGQDFSVFLDEKNLAPRTGPSQPVKGAK